MGQYPEVWLPRTPHTFGPNLESDLGLISMQPGLGIQQRPAGRVGCLF